MTIDQAFGCSETQTIAWNGCESCAEGDYYVDGNCNCSYSPIILSMVHGQKFNISSAENGVWFDLNADGKKHKTAWPVDVANVGFLYIRTAANITVHNLDTGETTTKANPELNTGYSLFGNYGGYKNGFEKLKTFDKEKYTGVADGKLDAADSIWTPDSLLVWFDLNRNGIVEDSELKSLDSLGIERLDLDYKTTNRVDGDGNQLQLIGKFWKKDDPKPFFMVDYVASVK